MPLARWFLLFTPSGIGAWIVHMLFFINLGVVALGVLGIAAEWKTDNDRAAGILGLIIFLLPAFLFRSIALRIAKSHAQRQSASTA